MPSTEAGNFRRGLGRGGRCLKEMALSGCDPEVHGKVGEVCKKVHRKSGGRWDGLRI